MHIDSGWIGNAPYLFLGNHIKVEVPWEENKTPEDWWHIEAVTCICAARVAGRWVGNNNQPLDAVIEQLSVLCCNADDDHFKTIHELRRYLVHGRFHHYGVKPMLFNNRASANLDRYRILIEDVLLGTDTIFSLADGTTARVKPAHTKADGTGVPMTVRPIDKRIRASAFLGRHIRYGAPAVARIAPKELKFPVDLADDFIAEPPNYPLLAGVVRTPIVSATGDIRTAVGYDKPSELYYAPDAEFRDFEVPQFPSEQWVNWAIHTLDYLFQDFALVHAHPDRRDFGSLYAILFEQFMLPMVHDGRRPLHAVTAPEGGQESGKTTLAQTVGAIVLGKEPVARSLGSREEEREKRITSWLLDDTEQFMLIDNVKDLEDSPTLSILASSSTFASRTLGASKSPILKNLRTWCLTFNGGAFSKDIIRRLNLVRFAPIGDKGKRKFVIDDTVEYALAHRRELVLAILVLIRHWVASGRPEDVRLRGIRSDFKSWQATVGACVGLYWSGLSEGLRAAKSYSIGDNEDQALLCHWQATAPQTEYTATTLMQIARDVVGTHAHVFRDCKNESDPYKARAFAKIVLQPLLEKGVLTFRIVHHTRWYALSTAYDWRGDEGDEGVIIPLRQYQEDTDT